MKKKLFALLLACIMLFALAACGGEPAPGGSPPGAGTEMPPGG